jgi:hypothetical protein
MIGNLFERSGSRTSCDCICSNVPQVKRSLQNLREKKDARGCLGVLETCIRPNFAAVESPRLVLHVQYTTCLHSYHPAQAL